MELVKEENKKERGLHFQTILTNVDELICEEGDNFIQTLHDTKLESFIIGLNEDNYKAVSINTTVTDTRIISFITYVPEEFLNRKIMTGQTDFSGVKM